MTTDNANRLELARISPEMTHEEAYQAIVAALKRQGIKVIEDEEEKPEKAT